MANRMEAKILIKSALLENSCSARCTLALPYDNHTKCRIESWTLWYSGTGRWDLGGDNRTERFNHDPVGVAGVATSVPRWNRCCTMHPWSRFPSGACCTLRSIVARAIPWQILERIMGHLRLQDLFSSLFNEINRCTYYDSLWYQYWIFIVQL